jgi:hypothetical protein
MLDHEFFPTPPRLISRLLAGIDWSKVKTVLEPQAGKADIAARVAKQIARARQRYYRLYDNDTGTDAIDCIEIDPDLRNTLKGGRRETEAIQCNSCPSHRPST